MSASESGHWYDRDNNPRYEIVGKNGKVRPTTLRDARKFLYVPSVTGITGVLAAPALERYKENQILDAAAGTPYQGDLKIWKAQIREKAKKHARDSAAEGTKIHGYLEAYYAGEAYPAEGEVYVEAVSNLVKEQCGIQEWSAERCFSHRLGFGGAVDIYTSGLIGQSAPILLDFKSKDFNPDDDKPKGYDNHVMQLAAYRKGIHLPTARCANVFVSRSFPGHCSIYWWEEEEVQRGWRMFEACLAIWKAQKRYDGGWS